MCNPSSSADGLGQPHEDGRIAPSSWAGRSRCQMIQQACTVGPATACFIDRLWDQALQEAYWQSLEVFQVARWHSPQRVERALTRILDRRAAGLDALRFVLVEELDRLSERPDADLYGQIEFPFMRGAAEQSGNAHASAAFSRTGSRASW
jgi:hypothetical protein